MFVEDNNNLKEKLIENNLLTKEQIEKISNHFDEINNKAWQSLKSNAYCIDYINNKFVILNPENKNIIRSFPLPEIKKDFKYSSDLFFSSNYTTNIDQETLQKEDDISLDLNGLIGLAITEDKRVYLYNNKIEYQQNLSLTRQLIFFGISKTKMPNYFYDFYLSLGNKYLGLSCRESGKVILFDIELAEFIAEIDIREEISDKVIYLAISEVNNKIYITDQVSSNLFIYDIGNKSIVRKNLYFGILGNINLAKNEKSLYLTTVKPENTLKNISSFDYTIIKEFPLKGDFFSNSGDLFDVINLSDDSNYLFFMTYLNEPNPYTPIINVIDTDKNKMIKRFSIKDKIKPTNLATKEYNPVSKIYKSFEELLVESDLVSEDTLKQIKETVKPQTKPEHLNKDNVIEVERMKKDLEFDGIKDEPKDINDPIPKKNKHVIIPESANKIIVDILLGAFWQENNIDLTEIEIDLSETLNIIADDARKKIQYFDIAIVKFPKIYKDFRLKSIIQRQFILESLEDEENKKELATAPTNCPKCRAPLFGSWSCEVCGFNLDKPEEIIMQKNAKIEHKVEKAIKEVYKSEIHSEKIEFNKNPKISSETKIKNNHYMGESETKEHMIDENEKKENTIIEVKKEYISPPINTENTIIPSVVCDDFSLVTPLALLTVNKINNALYLIDRQAKVLWSYEFNNKSSLNQIEVAELTPRKTVIFADQHKIYEINLSNKKIIRTLDFKTKSLSLNGENIVITDVNDNQVKEIDTEDKVVWFYHFNGIYSEPNYATRLKNGNTLIIYPDEHYILEIDKENKEIWSFGNLGKKGNDNSSLNNPKHVLRLANGNTLITDNKNNRVIEVDNNKNIVWEYEGINKNKLVLPNYAKRLKNGNTYISHTGNRQFLEVNNANIVVWKLFIDSVV